MSSRRVALVPILGAILAAGCIVQSLNPFYTEGAEVELPAILGRWSPAEDGKAEEGRKPWRFEARQVVTYDDDGLGATLDVTYFKVGEHTFVDSSPDEAHDDQDTSEWWNVHLLATHSLCRVTLRGDRLQLRPLDYEWLRDAVREKKAALPHVEMRGRERIVFTATPEEWEIFLRKFGGHDGAFPEEHALAFVRYHPKKTPEKNGEKKAGPRPPPKAGPGKDGAGKKEGGR